jgi:hypothetical protein
MASQAAETVFLNAINPKTLWRIQDEKRKRAVCRDRQD